MSIHYLVFIFFLFSAVFTISVFAQDDVIQKTLNEYYKSTPQKPQNRIDENDLLIEAASLRNPFIPKLPERKDITITSPMAGIPRSQDNSGQTIQPPAPQKKEIVAPNFRIQGLVWNTDQPQVIVNQEILGLGEMIDTWKIISINEGNIVVTAPDGTQFTVKTSFDN